jgi:hypothetical protein
LANVLLAKVLLANVPPPIFCSISSFEKMSLVFPEIYFYDNMRHGVKRLEENILQFAFRFIERLWQMTNEYDYIHWINYTIW